MGTRQLSRCSWPGQSTAPHTPELARTQAVWGARRVARRELHAAGAVRADAAACCAGPRHAARRRGHRHRRQRPARQGSSLGFGGRADGLAAHNRPHVGHTPARQHGRLEQAPQVLCGRRGGVGGCEFWSMAGVDGLQVQRERSNLIHCSWHCRTDSTATQPPRKQPTCFAAPHGAVVQAHAQRPHHPAVAKLASQDVGVARHDLQQAQRKRQGSGGCRAGAKERGEPSWSSVSAHSSPKGRALGAPGAAQRQGGCSTTCSQAQRLKPTWSTAPANLSPGEGARRRRARMPVAAHRARRLVYQVPAT